MSTYQKATLNGVRIDLVSIKDSEEKIINLSMYKAKKLIDKVETSLAKLKYL